MVKTVNKFEEAKNLFGSLRITLQGSRYLGGAIGSESLKEMYVKKKVVHVKKKIAYCRYVSGISKRWLFTMRTIPDIFLLFKPLEEKIRECLIPSLVHRSIIINWKKHFCFAGLARRNGNIYL